MFSKRHNFSIRKDFIKEFLFMNTLVTREVVGGKKVLLG